MNSTKTLSEKYLFYYNCVQFASWLYIVSVWEKQVRAEVMNYVFWDNSEKIDSLALYANIKYLLYFCNGVSWLEFVNSLLSISKSKPFGVFNQTFARFVCTYFIVPNCEAYLASPWFRLMVFVWFSVDLVKYL